MRDDLLRLCGIIVERDALGLADGAVLSLVRSDDDRRSFTLDRSHQIMRGAYADSGGGCDGGGRMFVDGRPVVIIFVRSVRGYVLVIDATYTGRTTPAELVEAVPPGQLRHPRAARVVIVFTDPALRHAAVGSTRLMVIVAAVNHPAVRHQVQFEPIQFADRRLDRAQVDGGRDADGAFAPHLNQVLAIGTASAAAQIAMQKRGPFERNIIPEYFNLVNRRLRFLLLLSGSVRRRRRSRVLPHWLLLLTGVVRLLFISVLAIVVVVCVIGVVRLVTCVSVAVAGVPSVPLAVVVVTSVVVVTVTLLVAFFLVVIVRLVITFIVIVIVVVFPVLVVRSGVLVLLVPLVRIGAVVIGVCWVISGRLLLLWMLLLVAISRGFRARFYVWIVLLVLVMGIIFVIGFRIVLVVQS